MVKSTAQALELVRKHDAAKLYDSLEPWQQQELLCIVRRLVNSPAGQHEKTPARLALPTATG